MPVASHALVRSLIAILVPLSLAGCVQGAYGSRTFEVPYPPYGYPPAGSYPQYPDPNQPPPPRCALASSRDWRAWINLMPGPGSQPRLVVTGTAVTPTGGSQVGFDPLLQIRQTDPAQAFATVTVAPTGAFTTQAFQTHQVRWEWPLAQPVGSVVIRCGDQTLAQVSPVENAY